jgi:Tol biopolymer transport system component
MGDQPVEQPASVSQDRLNSWKEIASYLQRDVTTVQRWEKREGMPVHRHVHERLGSVYAFRSELDAWTRSRSPQPASDIAADEPTERVVRRQHLVLQRWSIAALVIAAAAATTGWWILDSRDYFWRNPLADAAFQTITDFAGTKQAGAISPDGRFVAFLSDRDGQADVWVTHVGTGQFHNLTRGRVRELVNPSVRTLDFSPDAALVTFWTRGAAPGKPTDVGVWAVPTLGGEPRPYLEDVAEFDWSRDGSRLVYHTAAPGDPMFVKQGRDERPVAPIHVATAGLHGHFPVWSPDGRFIYFVEGTLPDAMDIWRVGPTGGAAEQITQHRARVSHPVFLDARTLAYLATDSDGSGPWVYSIDVERRVPRRIGNGPDRYTSLAASGDGRRLVATLANPKGTFWRLRLANALEESGAATPIALTTARGVAPRLGPGYLLYVASKGTNDAVWKLVGDAATELWSEPSARVIGGPDITADGEHVAFAVERQGTTQLYTMAADGTGTRIITSSLKLRGAPAWARDGRSIIASVDVGGMPRLFRISLDGAAAPLAPDYAVDPVWSPDGDFLVYSGADVGTTFSVKAVTAAGARRSFPDLTLTRGARRLRFLADRRAIVVMRGEIEHKDLWLIDLESGAERQLTKLPADFTIRDFDISPDGRDIVVERLEEQSDIVLIDLQAR